MLKLNKDNVKTSWHGPLYFTSLFWQCEFILLQVASRPLHGENRSLHLKM